MCVRAHGEWVGVFQLLNMSVTQAKALFEDVGQMRCNILNTQ